jgi:hypothetical protein
LTNPPPSSCSNIVLDDGSLTRAFRDMPTSIFHFASILALLSSQNQQVKSLLCFQFCRGKSYPRKHEHAPHPRDTHTDDEEPMSALHVAEVWPLFSTWWSKTVRSMTILLLLLLYSFMLYFIMLVEFKLKGYNSIHYVT